MKSSLPLLFLLSTTLLLAQKKEEAITEETAPVEVVFEEPGTWGVHVFKDNGKSGIMDGNNGKILLPAEYSAIQDGVKFNYVVQKDRKVGVFNTTRNAFVLPVEYDLIVLDMSRSRYNTNDTVNFQVLVKKDGKYGLLDNRYRVLFPLEYEDLVVSRNSVRLRKNGKSGIWYYNRTWTDIPMEYDKITTPNTWFAASKNKKVSLYSPTGKLVSSGNNYVQVFQEMREYNNHMLLIEDGSGKQGIFNTKDSTFMVDVKYDSVYSKFGNNFIVSTGANMGVVRNNKFVIPAKYSSLKFLHPQAKTSLLSAATSKGVGLVNLNNKTIAKPKFDTVEGMNDLYKLGKSGKYTVVDSTGKAITSQKFDQVGLVYGGRFAVFNDNKIGYMDFTGKMVEDFTRTSPARGYRSVHELFEVFAATVRADDETRLREFARDIVPDEYTKEFFTRIHYEYRGFPTKLAAAGKTVEDANDMYFKMMMRFVKRIKDANEDVKTFEFVALDRDGYGYFDSKRTMWGTEAWGQFKTQNKTYRVKLGELMDVDGWWKTFTDFRY